jgi:hypothetical protein
MKEVERILMFSTRIIFSKSVIKRYKNENIKIDSYKDYNGDLSLVNTLIISPESVWRIQTNYYYELVIVDEIEAVRAQLQSSTVQHPNDSYFAFIRVLQSAKSVVMLDANITKATIEFCKQIMENKQNDDVFFRRKNAIIQRNTFVPMGRIAHYLNFMGSVSAMQDGFVMRILQHLKMGKNIGVFSCSANFAKRLYKDITEAFPNINTLLYLGESDDKIKAELENVNEIWGKANCVIYSPCIVTGLNCDIENHFHSMFAYLNGQSVNCKESSQAIHRIRDLIDDDLYFVVDESIHQICLTTYKSVLACMLRRKKHICLQFQMLTGDKGRLSYEEMQQVRYRIEESGRLQNKIDERTNLGQALSGQEIKDVVLEHEEFVMSEMKRYSMKKCGLCIDDIPDIVFQNAVYCELENDIHRSGFLSVFGTYLEKTGYVMDFEDIVAEESTVKPDEYADPTSAYDTTSMINEEEYKHYRKCIMKGNATKVMKEAAWKYEFEIMLYVDRLPDDIMKILFDAMHNNSMNRKIFDQVYIETHRDLEEVLTTELDRVRWVELLNPICEVLASVRNICEIFGLKNSLDTDTTFTTEDIFNNMALLDKELRAIRDKIKFRFWSKQKELSVAKVRSMLKAFFGAWSGMTLESVSEIRTKNDHIITYSLFPKDVFSKTLKNISGR